jgi:hypothetical protein
MQALREDASGTFCHPKWLDYMQVDGGTVLAAARRAGLTQCTATLSARQL